MSRRRRRPDLRTRLLAILTALAVAVIGAGAYQVLRPLPSPQLSSSLVGTQPGTAYPVPLPKIGSSAVAVEGLGLVAGRSVDAQVSTASLAKVILALCVLQRAPLRLGEQGHTFTISTPDIEIYNRALALNGSTLGVVRGEQLTEYQALQGLMIPSADNIADSLARWYFGSHQAYVAYATRWLVAHGLRHTHLGADASGLHTGTSSTARDLVQLGLIAMKHPVLAEIGAQSGAVFPVVGYKANYDTVLGQEGIDGLKTGNNSGNHGAFLFTSRVRVGDRTVAVAGVILGQDSLQAALAAAPAVVKAVRAGLRLDTIAAAGDRVGQSTTPWSATSPVTVASNLQVLRWPAMPVMVSVDPSGPWLVASTGTGFSRVPLTAPAPTGPSFWWRLLRD